MPPFQFEDVGTSLARCQRYFTKTLGAYESSSGGSGSKRVHWQFKQTMRATPTIVEAGTTKSGVQLLNADTYGINRSGDNAATLGSGTTAEAELW